MSAMPDSASLNFPPTFVLKTRFNTGEEQEELHRIEDAIKPNLRFNVREAKVVLGKVNRAGRAKHDLRSLGLLTEEFSEEEDGANERRDGRAAKRRRVDAGKGKGKQVVVAVTSGSETESEGESGDDEGTERKRKRSSSHSSQRSLDSQESSSKSISQTIPDGTVKVLNIKWFYDSVDAGMLLPMTSPYLVYHGRVLASQASPQKENLTSSPSAILSRARADTPPPKARPFGQYARASPNSQSSQASHSYITKSKHSQLHHEDTLDHDATEDMPPLPSYLKTRWSCERPTPMNCPNDDFIAQLKIIRQARELESNEQHHAFSAKSYSASIAVIQAYPYRIKSVAELLRLPGCGEKVAKNWIEWHETGEIQEVKEIEGDERLRALNTFWNIHQVADTTARKFYDQYGWKDLEDLIEYGWDTLTRDQQIGLKFYDELSQRIPRAEVHETEQVILEHANRLRPGFHICTVGGYRRGKETSGDMDFILSHPDESVTQNFIGHLLDALRDGGWVRYELTVSFRNSERGQATLAWRGNNGIPKKRAGFDTLDHAFVVWKDPHKGEDRPHRRVDIIISPWKTAGCAVLGWSGGKLFEQHLRSWVKEKKGWKFDSSGVRSRGSGTWIDLESRKEDKGREGEVTLEEKERRVFEGLGLKYLEPTLRCTH